MNPSDIPFSVLEKLFPFYVWIVADLSVLNIGPSLKKIFPEAKIGGAAQDLFKSADGRKEQIDLQMLNTEGDLLTLRPGEKDVLLRGQSVQLPDHSFFIAASPWLHSHDKLGSLDLGVNDFAVHDPILDLLNLIQSERMAKGEIKALVDHLSKQRASLKEANQSLEAQNQTILQTKRELEEQASAAKKLAHVASRTDNSVVITNSKGEIEWVNESFEKLTEFSLEEIIGKRPGQFLQGEETSAETVAYMSRQLEACKGFNVEIVNYSKSGRKYWLRIEVQPIFNSGDELTHFIAVETDITAQKQTEERLTTAKIKAEQASKAMSEFLATVSHEIRTPMNGIIGMLEILTDTALDTEQSNYLSLIRVSSEALLKIINHVLDLSKIQASRFELESHPFELRKLTDEIVGLMAFSAGKKGLNFEILVHPGLYNHWIGDASRLRQILINLVGNAIKFTESGSVHMRITSTSPAKSEMESLCFEIIDTGIGIPKDRLEDIYNPFTQVEYPGQKQIGTGLGLSISKQLVELMKGTLPVASEEGKGTTFQVVIPMEPSEIAPTKKVSSAFVKFAISVTPDAFTKEVISNHLRTKGMEHRAFDNLKEGLQFLEETSRADVTAHYFLMSEEMISKEDPKMLTICFDLARKRVKDFRVIMVASNRSKRIQHAPYPFADNMLFRPLTYDATDGMHRSVATHSTTKRKNISSVQPPDPSTQFDPSIRLLLSEDHPINLEQMTLLLKRLGITPDTARNGLEAVEAIKNKEYDVVLMDCQMPIMDGLEAASLICELNQQGQLKKKPYIIAVTAFALQGDREKCLKSGMDAYISKPVYKKDLVDALKVALGQEQGKQAEENEAGQSEKFGLDMESAYRKLCSELNEETAVALTQSLIEMLPGKSFDLNEFLQKNDREAISRFGHSLKSISKMNGLTTLAALSLDLEQTAESLDREELEDLVAVTQREIMNAKNDLIDLLSYHSLSI